MTRPAAFAFVLVTLFGAQLVANPLSASERDATATEARQVISKLLDRGYRSVTDVDVVGNRFIADAISAAGKDVDVVLDRETLRILEERPS